MTTNLSLCLAAGLGEPAAPTTTFLPAPRGGPVDVAGSPTSIPTVLRPGMRGGGEGRIPSPNPRGLRLIAGRTLKGRRYLGVVLRLESEQWALRRVLAELEGAVR